MQLVYLEPYFLQMQFSCVFLVFSMDDDVLGKMAADIGTNAGILGSDCTFLTSQVRSCFSQYKKKYEIKHSTILYH